MEGDQEGGLGREGVPGLLKGAADFAPGLPAKKDLGDLALLRAGEVVDYLVQHHKAHRAGPHYDVRVGDKARGMYSWAVPRGVPVPGEKGLAVRQPVHRHSYNNFEGEIPRGVYGAGSVRKHDQGRILITKVTDDQVHFTRADTRHPERFVMVRPKGFGKDNDWLMINATPTEKVPYAKLRYKKVPHAEVEAAIRNMGPDGTVEPKVDGASQLTQLARGTAELTSYRTSKETGRPIVNTEKVLGGRPKLDYPRHLEGSILKGELYAAPSDGGAGGPGARGPAGRAPAAGIHRPGGDGRPDTVGVAGHADGGDRQPGPRPGLPDGAGNPEIDVAGGGTQPAHGAGGLRALGPQDVGTLLNSSVERSLDIQRQGGTRIRNMLYDVQQYGGKPVDPSVPREERRRMMEEILPHLPKDTFHLSEPVPGGEPGLKLWDQIRGGEHPLTREGVVMHPATGVPMKGKLTDDHDVYITGTYPGEGKRQATFGGFTYGHEPGKTVGRVGSGFSDLFLSEAAKDPTPYVGRVARVRAQEKLPSGALRAPVFLGMHEDYNKIPKVASHGVVRTIPRDGRDHRGGEGVRRPGLRGLLHDPGRDENAPQADRRGCHSPAHHPRDGGVAQPARPQGRHEGAGRSSLFGGETGAGLHGHGMPVGVVRLPAGVKSAALLPHVKLQPQQERVRDRSNAYDPRLLVYHGLGRGKSLASLAAAEQSGSPYAAVVPAALRPNYNKEIAKFTDAKTPHDVLSYTQVGMGQQPKQAPSTLILDEAQRLRNPDSAMTKNVKDMAMKADRVLMLSGTPIVNRPNDLSTPLSILTRKDISPQEFDRRFVGQKEVSPGVMGWLQGVKPVKVPAIKHEEELEGLLRGHVDYDPGRSPEGVHTAEERVEVDMSPQQKDFYRLMFNKLPWLTRWKMQRNYPMTASELQNLQSFMTGPRQAALSLYPFQSQKDPYRAFQESAKLQRAFKDTQETLAANPQAKVIAYSNFIDAGLTPYEAALKANNVPYSILHGKLNDAERKEQLDNYNSGKSRVLLYGPSSAEGISAQGTQMIQLLDPHWNEARMGQAKGRGLRFDSHEGLPEELKNVAVRRYIARMPEPGFFGRLFGDQRRPSADEFLEAQSRRKEDLLDQYRDVLKRVGSEPPTRPWYGLFS